MKSTNRRITFNEILLITGFPPWDDPSVLLATGIAKVHDAKLHIVHPLPSTMLQGTAWVREDSALATLWTDIVSRPSTRQTIIGLEEVGPRLRSLASRHDIDLVVVSTSSVSVSARRLIQDVFMEFECPIFMVGPEVETATYEPSTIVYATDFSPHAIGAAPFAFSLAQQHQSALTLFHVIEGVGAWTEQERLEIESPFRQWMAELLPDEAANWCKVEHAVRFGKPADEITRVVNDLDAGLVVMGVNGVDGTGDLLPGETAFSVMSRVRCPVLLVRDTNAVSAGVPTDNQFYARAA